jgi:hypothetical protein
LFWFDAFPLRRMAAWLGAELVNSLKLPKFPARDLKRALVQAASVRALNHRESTVRAVPQKSVL